MTSQIDVDKIRNTSEVEVLTFEAGGNMVLAKDLKFSSLAAIKDSTGNNIISESGGLVTLENTSLGDTVLMPDNSNNVSTAPGIRFEADIDTGIGLASSGNLAIVTGGTERMRIDSSGRVTMPYQPAFQAYNSGSGIQYSARIVPFTNVTVNNGNHYDGTDKFTAPVAGIYQFSTFVQLFNASSGTVTGIFFYKNGSQVTTGGIEMVNNGNGAHTNLSGSQVIYLSAGDYVQVYANNTHRELQSGFSGYLIG